MAVRLTRHPHIEKRKEKGMGTQDIVPKGRKNTKTPGKAYVKDRNSAKYTKKIVKKC